MHRHAIAISLALSTALLPGLRGSNCPPGNTEDSGSHAHAGVESHHHADGSTSAHNHLDLAGSEGNNTHSDPACCQAAKAGLGAISSSPNNPAPKRLPSAHTLPGRLLNTHSAQFLRDPRSLFRQERASPFVRTRAPLLI